MKKSLQILALAMAVLSFATISPALLAAPADTGIQGRAALYISYGISVEIEPGSWVGVGDVMLPVATSFSILSAHSGHEVGRFSTGADGGFTISLPPGKYVIVPDTLSIGGSPESVSTSSFEVTVAAKQLTYALILYYHEGFFRLVPAPGE